MSFKLVVDVMRYEKGAKMQREEWSTREPIVSNTDKLQDAMRREQRCTEKSEGQENSSYQIQMRVERDHCKRSRKKKIQQTNKQANNYKYVQINFNLTVLINNYLFLVYGRRLSPSTALVVPCIWYSNDLEIACIWYSEPRLYHIHRRSPFCHFYLFGFYFLYYVLRSPPPIF